MATLKAPLFSISAKGHFSNLLTYFSHTGRSYLMTKRNRRGLFVGGFAGFGRMPFGAYFFGYSGRIGSSRFSASQIAQRELFSATWDAYALLTPEEKEILRVNARSLNMTGANLFMSNFIKENT